MEDILLSSAHLYMLFPLFLGLTALLLTSHNCKSASIPEQEIISHLNHRDTDDIIPLFYFFAKFTFISQRSIFFSQRVLPMTLENIIPSVHTIT